MNNLKKIILISCIGSSFLLADKMLIPLPSEYLAVENAGQKTAIDAYQDGVGIYAIEAIGANKIDNSAMNELVFKYGEESKRISSTIKDFVLENGTNEEKVKANSLGNFEAIMPANGTVCNDENSQTVNDIFTNGICAGTIVNGTSCNDGNAATYGDKYTNGVCAGIIPKTCNDLYLFNSSMPSGTYNIKPINITYSVTCTMAEDGGWTNFTGFIAGSDGFPGNNASTQRDRITHVTQYNEIANKSTYQKVGVSGASESCCDPYGLKNYSGTTIYTARGSVNTTLTINVANNYVNAMRYSYYSTDGSVNGGAGLSINSIQFK